MVWVLRTFFWPMVVVAIGLWFSFFSFEGRYGLKALDAAETRLSALEERLDSLQARKLRLERLNEQLQGPAPDRDLIEERARVILGFAHPNDAILTRRELERLIGRVDD